MDTKYTKMIYENDSIVSYYNEITGKFGLFKSEEIIISKYLNKKDKILDIGCGAGRTTIGIYKLGYKNIIGIDISNKMIEKAKQNFDNIRFEVADTINLPFDDNYFDSIIFPFNGLMLIPKLENRLKALKEIKRVLKKNGTFIFTTPYLDNKIDTDFWKKRIEILKIDLYEEEFGDLYIDDMGVKNIYIHVPFIQEVEKMLENSNLIIIDKIPRMDISLEAKYIEEELDDNIFWITKG
ncbi:MAG: class I SAM-dependent methyltransferase [Paraclostridium sordellii]